MASPVTLRALVEPPAWIPPQSDTRIVLGEPVEPSNAFAPGVRSCGMTRWLSFPESGAIYSVEAPPHETLRRSLVRGYLPLVQ